MKKLAILSLSGGMDSTSLLIHLLAERYKIKTYYFDYGSRQNKIELKKIELNLIYLKKMGYQAEFQKIDLRDIFCDSTSALFTHNKIDVPEEHYTAKNQKVTVVENRNAIFSNIIFSKALSWAKRENSEVKISLGIHAGDHAIYKDCTPEFREAMEKAMKLGNDNAEMVNYYTPYLKFFKETILFDLLKNCNILQIDPMIILSNTNTCYNPDSQGIACGKCGSCVERLEAFLKCRTKDPIPYKQ